MSSGYSSAACGGVTFSKRSDDLRSVKVGGWNWVRNAWREAGEEPEHLGTLRRKGGKIWHQAPTEVVHTQ